MHAPSVSVNDHPESALRAACLFDMGKPLERNIT
jgi:hypothetical protein